MATFTSPQVDGNQVFKPFPDGNLGVRYAKYVVAAALNANDVFQMVDVFSGETVHNVKIKVSDLDAGSALVLDVGDDGDVDRFIDGSTAGQTGVADHADANGAPHPYTADNTVDVLCTVAPGTDVTTGTIEMWVYVS
jgi:hypothetical protein